MAWQLLRGAHCQYYIAQGYTLDGSVSRIIQSVVYQFGYEVCLCVCLASCNKRWLNRHRRQLFVPRPPYLYWQVSWERLIIQLKCELIYWFYFLMLRSVVIRRKTVICSDLFLFAGDFLLPAALMNEIWYAGLFNV